MSILIAGTGVVVPGAPPPAAPVNLWPGVTDMTWVGWDGSRWPLLSIASGAVLVNEKVKGLGFPDFLRYASKAQGVPGSRWRGWDVDERDVFWPLMVFSDGGTDAWLRHNAALMATFRPDRTGTWIVTTSLGTRRLRCRLAKIDDAFDVDPSRVGWFVYGIGLVAEDPYWRGDAESITWRAQGQSRAFLPKLGETGFWLSSSFTAGSARVSNRGDVDSYPVHELAGPINAGAKVGVGGSTVTVPFAVPSGQSLTIDTRPDRLTVTDQAGTSRFPDLTGDVAFPPIPAGEDVPITVEFSGAGTITTTFEPAFWRAF